MLHHLEVSARLTDRPVDDAISPALWGTWIASSACSSRTCWRSAGTPPVGGGMLYAQPPLHERAHRRRKALRASQGDIPPHCRGVADVMAFMKRSTQPRRLKNWMARSCFSAAARVANVPRFRRFPVRGSIFREYNRYSPDLSLRIISPSCGSRQRSLPSQHARCFERAERVPHLDASVLAGYAARNARSVLCRLSKSRAARRPGLPFSAPAAAV